MKKPFNRYIVILVLLLIVPAAYAVVEEPSVQSVHAGFLYPNGVDVVGYSVEKQIRDHLYRFYTFGIPSFAAIGVGYYKNYDGNGLSAAFGVGIGSIMYGSLSYQWKIGKVDYLKLGAGVTTGVAYTGSYPVVSYEYRF